MGTDGQTRRDEEPDLTDAEAAALHDLRLGVEHIHRGYGHLLAFHHQVGHAMDRFADARDRLRAAGHDGFADRLRDELLPAGVVEDRWTYELVEAFETGFLAEVVGFEQTVRDRLADGADHVTERAQQQRWRRRAER
ncbi:hypothetical protein [Halosegnis sp.]|uniref:hypothetical protein n=1 Tax=Halosegnis sp. TaxID=2864959 RepID=UPI0035D40861